MQYYAPILKRSHPDDHPKRLRDLEHFQGITDRYRSLERLLADMALEPPTIASEASWPWTRTRPGDPFDDPFCEGTGMAFRLHHLGFGGKVPLLLQYQHGRGTRRRAPALVCRGTRAKENLFISYPIKIFDRGLRMVLSRPSQFIEGISEDLLEPVTVVDEERNWGWEP